MSEKVHIMRKYIRKKTCHTEPNKLKRQTPINESYHSLSEVIFSFKKETIKNLFP